MKKDENIIIEIKFTDSEFKRLVEFAKNKERSVEDIIEEAIEKKFGSG